MQNYNYFYLNEMNISSIRKRCAESLKSSGELTLTCPEMPGIARLPRCMVILHLSHQHSKWKLFWLLMEKQDIST